MLKKLSFLLSRKDKRFLIVLLLLSIFISLIETIGVGLIMPFISLASDFSKVQSNEYFLFLYNMFAFKSPLEFVVSFGFFLVVFYIFRAVVNYIYFYILNHFAQGRYHVIAYKLFENYMGMHYHHFIGKNSSFLTKNIVDEASNVVQLISFALFMSSEIFVLIFVYGMLLLVNWKMTFLLTFFLGINVLLLRFFVSFKIKKAGEERAEFQKNFYEILTASFGNYKIIKLKDKDEEVLQHFAQFSSGYATAKSKSATLSQFPRLFLEMLGFSLVTIIIIYLLMKYQQDIQGALPLLMVFVLGLYRLLPSVNRIFTSYNQILFFSKSLDIVHNELLYENEGLKDKTISFSQEIQLQHIFFSYDGKKNVLEDISLVIKKGEKVGIVGESGSGKSTLVDLLIGLYQPLKGSIVVDGVELSKSNLKSWRRKIGYIPQSIYLADGTIASNVAFLEAPDEQRVKEVLAQAKILEFLEQHNDGIYTQVGENGIKLSGGQKQRIAIARALYNDPEILILDEATSALDTKTEQNIMQEIYTLARQKTMIIIAHRISTLDKCNKIIHLEDGKIVKGN